MTSSRQRVAAAFAHRQPDRVPIDLGSTATSGIHCTCVEQLRRYYGLEKRPVTVHEPFQMLGWIEDDLRDALGIDFTCPMPASNMFGFANEQWRAWRTPWNQEVLVPRDFKTSVSDRGDLLIYPQGDTSAPPSGQMPVGGFFFDSIIRQGPLDEDRLDPQDNLEEYGLLSEADIGRLAQAAAALDGSDRARVGSLPGTGLGDIAMIPGPSLKHPRGVRAEADWYMITASRPDLVHAIFEKQVQTALINLQRLAKAIGDRYDAVWVCGTDLGTQTSQFCSVDTFRSLYKPYYQRINQWVHQNTTWKTFKHSCGAVEPFIAQFIDSGFDLLNPVQCSAAGMDPRQLKQAFGRHIVFWGGGVDTQQVLPFGTPEQVRRQVLQRCEIFAPQGGFVFAAIHNIQANTPLENIVAMFNAVHEFNGSRPTA